MTKKVRTYKKVKQVGVLETRLGNYIVLEPFNEIWKLYDSGNGITVVPDLESPPFTDDWKYNMYGLPRLLVIEPSQFLKFEKYEKSLDVLVWDGNYIIVPDEVEDVQDYFFSDEDEFAFPVTQDEFDRIFDTYYDDKENE